MYDTKMVDLSAVAAEFEIARLMEENAKLLKIQLHQQNQKYRWHRQNMRRKYISNGSRTQ